MHGTICIMNLLETHQMLAEYWLDPLSKFWSGQYKDKVKVE